MQPRYGLHLARGVVLQYILRPWGPSECLLLRDERLVALAGRLGFMSRLTSSGNPVGVAYFLQEGAMDTEQAKPDADFERQVDRYIEFRWGGKSLPDPIDDAPDFCPTCQLPTFKDMALGDFAPCSACKPTESALYHAHKSRVLREAYRRQAPDPTIV
ncbi:hypothetical protein Q3G72_033254 [Acer saccharum]|nr:hypothetical protein Q3G72_033254 [Acer saccharum]